MLKSYTCHSPNATVTRMSMQKKKRRVVFISQATSNPLVILIVLISNSVEFDLQHEKRRRGARQKDERMPLSKTRKFIKESRHVTPVSPLCKKQTLALEI